MNKEDRSEREFAREVLQQRTKSKFENERESMAHGKEEESQEPMNMAEERSEMKGVSVDPTIVEVISSL